MKQNEKTGKFYVLIAVALLVTSVAVAVAVAGPAPYPGTGPTPTPGPTPAPGPGGGPAPYPTPAPPGPTPAPTPPPGALPDLVVEDISADFTTSPGNVIIHFIIHNNGTAAAGASTTCKEVNGVVVNTDATPALGVSGRYHGQFAPEPCPPGTAFTVTVEADNYHVVAESNERNNNRTETFICPAGPQPGGSDLVINITQVEREVVGPNLCRYKVDWTATNIGNAGAGWNDVALFINGVKEDEEFCNALGPLASDTGDFFAWWNCPPACATPVNVEVRVDYYNVVAESSEGNNNDTNDVDCRLGGIEVTKTVRDNQAPFDLVDEIDAVYHEVVEFNCTVHNTGCCCNLTNITVTDVLSDSLEYLFAIPAPNITAITNGVTTLTWNVAGPLEPCEWLNYTIHAGVIGHGVDTNTQTAVATNCTGGTVTDTDSATVNVARVEALEVDKEVRDAAGNWVGVIDIDATAADVPVEFRCTVRNTGSVDLTNVEVRDVLNPVFANIVAAPGEDQRYGTTTLFWDVGALDAGQTRTYYIDATVLAGTTTGNTDYKNSLRARGETTDTGNWLFDTEEVIVHQV